MAKEPKTTALEPAQGHPEGEQLPGAVEITADALPLPPADDPAETSAVVQICEELGLAPDCTAHDVLLAIRRLKQEPPPKPALGYRVMRSPQPCGSVGTEGASYQANADGTFHIAHEHVPALLVAGFTVDEE